MSIFTVIISKPKTYSPKLEIRRQCSNIVYASAFAIAFILNILTILVNSLLFLLYLCYQCSSVQISGSKK